MHACMLSDSSGDNLMGVRKYMNERAFNHKSGRVGNKFISTSHCDLIMNAR